MEAPGEKPYKQGQKWRKNLTHVWKASISTVDPFPQPVKYC